MHWLIAEDESDILSLVSMMATAWGHTPMPFESGQRAWDFLDEVESGAYSGPLPEFALMDIRMPGYRGDEVAKRIRETDGIHNIPIVLMTAFVLTDDEMTVMQNEAGVDHIINKPLPDFAVLKATLESIIQEKQQSD